MLIIETSVFTRRVLKLLSDDDYGILQQHLVADPEAGDLVRGSGGLRKIRWTLQGRGKRGGVRVIYYWAARQQIILMLLIYSKNEQDDLAPGQLEMLKRTVEEEFK
jgi:mRNA-degrading endonuclease RelE of RelBE toxin-antitoxin system